MGRILILGLLALFTFSESVAEEYNQQQNKVTGQFVDIRLQEPELMVKELISQVHEGTELPETEMRGLKHFLLNWIQKLNLRDFAFGSLRYVNMKAKDPKTRDHVLNLVTLYSLSHLLEMSSGPIGMSIAKAAEADPAIIGLIGLAGTVVSIPGLDPLCLGVGLVYPFKYVQKGVTFIRIFIVRTTDAVAQRIGFKSFLERILIHHKDSLAFLATKVIEGRLGAKSNVEISSNTLKLHHRFNEAEVFLTYRLHGDVSYLSHVRIEGSLTALDFKQLSVLGPNASHGLRQLARRPLAYAQSLNFVVKGSESFQSREFELRPFAIRGPAWSLKSPTPTCRRLFQSWNPLNSVLATAAAH